MVQDIVRLPCHPYPPLAGFSCKASRDLSSTGIHMGAHLTVTPGGLELLLWSQIMKQEAGSCGKRSLEFI